MNATERIVRALAAIPSVRSETAVFVRMDGATAVVNIGTSTIALPCQGWYPPVVGMAVQVEWRDGKGLVTGPARVLKPVGTITGTGTPQATVTVDGQAFLLYIRTGYTPVIGDLVTVNWATGVIEGKISGQTTPVPPLENGGGGASFTDMVIRAENSGSYRGNWWTNDLWASNTNDCIWTVGNRVRDAIAGATITAAAIYLPLVEQVGNCSLGTHAHPSIPGGAPVLSNLTPLPIGGRSGWVGIPLAWVPYLAAGGRGIGADAPGGGLTRWRGTAADGLSGALRFSGSR